MKPAIFLLLCALCFSLPSARAQEPARLNKKNLVIKEWNTDVKTKARILDHQTIYSPEGKKIEETEYGNSGQKWRKRYEYGADGRVSRELLYDEHNRLNTVKKFEYNEFGRKKTQYTYDAKGKLKTIKVFEYVTEDA
ncbi:MAG: hypothetical protein J5871_06770 [Bacteroidales bacterium]|nr:hypothetical protein [Bacteroidales bacterium]